MRIVLDTNAYSSLRLRHADVMSIVGGAARVFLSTIVAGELMAGFRAGSRFDANMTLLRSFLQEDAVRVLPVRFSAADHYGRISAALRRKGRPIPVNDIWIAAQAMDTGATLLTHDAHFEAVDGLALARVRE